MLMLEGGQQRLARRAHVLKRAWLMAAALIGAPLDEAERSIPHYATWPRRRLVVHVQDLEEDLYDAVTRILLRPKRSMLAQFANWLSDAFQQCEQSSTAFSICTAQEFET